MGYNIGLLFSKRIRTKKKYSLEVYLNRDKFIFLIFIGAILAAGISLNVNNLYDLFNPVYLFRIIFNGIINPEGQYIKKMEMYYMGNSNKILNIILFILSPFQVLFVSILVFYWGKIKPFVRYIGLFIIFLVYIIPALKSGTNKPFFDLFIFLIISVYILKYYRNIWINNIFQSKKRRYQTKKRRRKYFLIIVAVLFIIPISFFSRTISARGGAPNYIESTAPQGDIKIKPFFKQHNSVFINTYIWFDYYLVQGYYGFSLALAEPFTPTFGIGNSIFLSRQFKDFLNIDISNRTYQKKISKYWDESAQWHSLYSYYANDFHFLGVSIICFVIGLLLAVIWYTFIYQANFWSYLMLSLLGLLIIFIPANNQVFGFLGSFSSFFFTFFMWIRSIRFRSAIKNHIEIPEKPIKDC